MIKKWWYRFHTKRLEKKKLQFIRWFHSKFPGKYCWADCVSWSYCSTKFNPFKIDNASSCNIESQTHDCKSCYCGSWQDGVCWDKLSKVDQDKMREQSKIGNEIDLDLLPF